MKYFLFFVGILFSQGALAGLPPAGFPSVNAVVRKIDVPGARVSLKHEAIPNLSMPAMTMSFLVLNPAELNGLAVGDNVHFAADEIDGEMTAIWIEKAVGAVAVAGAQLFCKGEAETTPRTKIELEIRREKFSTIRYEFAEGPFIGTSYVNSIGRLEVAKSGDVYTYSSGTGLLGSRLEVRVAGDKITESRFTNFSSGMTDSLVTCRVEQ